jgi:hypothetical protein
MWGFALGTFGWSWLVPVSCALTIGILVAAALAARARGWALFCLLACLHGGIGVLNIQIESLAFKVAPPAEVMSQVAIGLLEVLVIAGALAIAITHARPAIDDAARLPRRLWLRVLVVALSYVVLYSIAGSLLLPFVRHFYVNTSAVTIPPPGVIVATQVVRGLVYAIALLPFFRAMEGRRLHAAFLAGLALAILGGIAPQRLPVDAILPPDVRAAHMLEIFGSNFLLGVVGALLLVRRNGSAIGSAAPAVRASTQTMP